MASQVCWRCALRKPLRFGPSTQISPFSNSSLLAKNPHSPTKKGASGKVGPPQRGRKTLVISKKKRQVDTRRKPAEGERKAIRKRLVLSNTNALEVTDIREWSPETCCGSAGKQHEGQLISFGAQTVDALRAMESFKVTQGWSFFRHPTSLIRSSTLAIGDIIDRSSSGASKAETWRRLITGDRGVGKSVLLLQAHAMAFMKGWVVIHIPEAMELTSASTAYSPIQSSPGTSTTYAQRDYVAALLARIATANASVLKELSLAHKHNLPIPLQENMSLHRLAEMGGRDPEIAWDIYKALWTELDSTAADRPPIMFTLDGLAHISRFSAYLDPSMHHIHAHDLALVRQFLDLLTGSKKLENGGIILAADSASNRPSSSALDLAIEQSLAKSKLKSGSAVSDLDKALAKLSLHDPSNSHREIDQRSLRSLQGVEVLQLRGFSEHEARVMLEYYARSGMLRHTVTDDYVKERWSLSGNGIIGELERSTFRAAVS